MTHAHRILYVGNFRPAHSTENHVTIALRANGHHVVPWQEDQEPDAWRALPDTAADAGADLVLWTKTWNDIPRDAQMSALNGLSVRGIPTVGYHLDRWWGLDRQAQIHEHPFFRVDLLCTADGGHDVDWARVGIQHRWFPPAVLGAEAAVPGVRKATWERDVAFVGSWGNYHHEWPHRRDLIRFLRSTYEGSGMLGLWPRQGERSIRGGDLADLYASTKVVVGDSCLAGGASRYWSDRIPETIGRGGFLLHPVVDGLDEHFTPDQHLVLYEPGDWGTLRALVRAYLEDDDERQRIARAGRAHVLEHHTYEVRMRQLIQLLHDEGWVASPDHRSGPVVETDRAGRRARFDLRHDTDDALVVSEQWREDTYRVHDWDLTGKTVLDLGANVGAFTVWACAAGAASVIAVEPDADNASQLRQNVHVNGYTDRVSVIEAAVISPRTATARATIAQDGASTRTTDWRAGDWGIPAVGLWDVAPVWLKVDVLKVDVEGMEYQVLTEADLSQFDRIVMEYHGPRMPGMSDVPGVMPGAWGALIEHLAAHGHVQTMGDPSLGGFLWWTRYGA